MSSEPPRAIEKKLALCLYCYQLNQANSQRCVRCGGKISLRRDANLHKTIAWLLSAVAFYIPANVLPVMTTTTLMQPTDNTIISGVFELWLHGDYLVSVIIFLASIVIPITKILILAWLSWSIKSNHTMLKAQKMRLYHFSDWIGRWSMIDIFVVAILVSLIQINGIMQIFPGIAALAFSGVVLCTMRAAQTFDSRLIWDVKSDP